MALTVSTHYAIPTLIGKGLTENAARKTLAKARLLGHENASIGGTRVLPVTYAGGGMFTIGAAS